MTPRKPPVESLGPYGRPPSSDKSALDPAVQLKHPFIDACSPRPVRQCSSCYMALSHRGSKRPLHCWIYLGASDQ